MWKPRRPEKCGNITIPYPFGIGSECSANSNFTVICQNSTNPPTPFLSSINMEALNISVLGIVIVNQPVSPLNCSDVQTTQYLATSLLGTPFTISAEYNSLVVLGCQISVWLRANATAAVGGLHGDMRRKFHGHELGLLNHPLNPFDQEFGSAPLVLEWEFYGTDPCGRSNVACRYPDGSRRYSPFGNDYVSSERFCFCYFGDGSVTGGCTDIDECSRARLNGYCINGTCTIRQGGFECRYPDDNTRSRIKIAFISIGSALGALILLLASWKSAKAIRKKIKANRKHKFFKRNGGLLLQQQLSATDNGLDKTKLFSSKELAQATDRYNENRILGRGGQGTVYKRMLTDGRIVALKKSKRVDEGDLEDFINEVVILSQINHRNVVKLLGCCLETEVPLLVYEFIPNGTLFQHVHDPSEEFPLSWEIRLRIAREIAGALSYLHSAASAPIYHRDIKWTNILLDDKYRAKVSDFGTSRSIAIDQTHLTTRVLGTFGYLDPKYFQSSQFTEKSDVYSFGVIMVELLTGEKAISSVRAEVGKSLATHFLHSMEENLSFEIVDPRVLTEGSKEEIVAVAQLARRCLHLNGKRRPTMKEVAVELEGIQMLKVRFICRIDKMTAEIRTTHLRLIMSLMISLPSLKVWIWIPTLPIR
ncbi:hypothetical protein DH2020_031993 [Rehmannia glutinosa]|uniref:Protein kinase domain-containing protein n=1 Tax=Rehmannia glutinosa TaxID=99300 RepID=A0ABR0VH76_REHGL